MVDYLGSNLDTPLSSRAVWMMKDMWDDLLDSPLAVRHP